MALGVYTGFFDLLSITRTGAFARVTSEVAYFACGDDRDPGLGDGKAPAVHRRIEP